jgi:hypothetical protein
MLVHRFAAHELFESNTSSSETVIRLERLDNTPNLSGLSALYGSDKGTTDPGQRTPSGWFSHTYTPVYELLLAPQRSSATTIVECGIGTNYEDVPSNMSATGVPGASLRMWRDYFPHATIYGLDIDARVLFEEDRIRTYCVDQTDRESIRRFWQASKLGDVDVFIDDGLHTFDAGIVLFEESFTHIAPQGSYIIEDVGNETLTQYKEYFAHQPYDVGFLTMHRTGQQIGDNTIVLIRHASLE